MEPKAHTDSLVRLSLDTLPRMIAPEKNLFCCELSRDDATPRYDPEKSERYTIMSLLGLARARAAGHETPLDLDAIHGVLLDGLGALSTGDLGLMLWLDHRLGAGHAAEVASALRKRLDADNWHELITMEVAWLVTGLAVYCAQGATDAEDLEDAVVSYFLENRGAPSGLVYHAGEGMRRRFPNFASQIYATHCLSIRARLRGDAKCGERARAIGERLERLQFANGAWPWVYDAERGTVVEPFEIYSVHQDAMAPMGLLELNEATGYDTSEMIRRGLGWLTGDNEIGAEMADDATGLVYRSIRRKKPIDRLALYSRTLASTVGYESGETFSASGLELNATCRPYHLGWILEAWCDRKNLSEILGGDASQ